MAERRAPRPPLAEVDRAWLLRRMEATDRVLELLRAEQARLRQAVQRLGGAHATWRDGPVREVLRLVAGDYGLAPRLLLADWRRPDVVEARQVTMWIAREALGVPATQIGRQTGRRDHTTVLHAVRAVEARRARDAGFRDRVERLRAAVMAAIREGEE